MTIDFRDFLRRHSGHVARNAMAGGYIHFTNTGVLATSLFGGFNTVSAVAGHTAHVTWANTVSSIVPMIGFGPIQADTVFGGQGSQVFPRVISKVSNAATIGLFAGVNTVHGTVHVIVYGQMRSDVNTGFF